LNVLQPAAPCRNLPVTSTLGLTNATARCAAFRSGVSRRDTAAVSTSKRALCCFCVSAKWPTSTGHRQRLACPICRLDPSRSRSCRLCGRGAVGASRRAGRPRYARLGFSGLSRQGRVSGAPTGDLPRQDADSGQGRNDSGRISFDEVSKRVRTFVLRPVELEPCARQLCSRLRCTWKRGFSLAATAGARRPVMPNMSVNRTRYGKIPSLRGALCLSCTSRPARLASARRLPLRLAALI
jgi:hypothetical protein